MKVRAREEVVAARLSRLGLTRAELAERCGVDPRTLRRWLSGQRVTLEVAERVAGALGLGTGEVYEDVPVAGLLSSTQRVGAMHRALATRDGVVAQMLRLLPVRYGPLLDNLSFRPHPSHGFVRRFHEIPGEPSRFVVLRLECAAEVADVTVFSRLAKSLLVRRAFLHLRAEQVWLRETFFVRSMSALRRPDGGLDLWHWIGPIVEEVCLSSTAELRAEVIELCAAESLVFDMALGCNAHSVCVRPVMTELHAAKLPPGFDRIAHRACERIDVGLPADLTPL